MFDRTRRKKSDVIFRAIYRIIFYRFKDIIDRNCVQTFSTNFVEKKQSVVTKIRLYSGDLKTKHRNSEHKVTVWIWDGSVF